MKTSLGSLLLGAPPEVQLSGFIDAQKQVDRAINVASRIEGVHSVKNEMSHKK